MMAVENNRKRSPLSSLRNHTAKAAPEEADDDANWFYGPKAKKQKQKLDDEIDPKAKPHFAAASAIHRNALAVQAMGPFQTFSRQRDSLAELAKHENDGNMRVFSCELDGKDGARNYIVSSLDRFWHWYGDEERQSRQFYELILENRPCRLYFDLEFYRDANPQMDDGKCLAEFLDMFRLFMREQLDTTITEKNILQLDASTPKKFSRHLIVHLPDQRLFPNNLSLKVLVERLADRLKSSNQAMVNYSDLDKKVPLCDLGVYTRNRNFRLFLSSKAGQQNPLKLVEDTHFYGSRITMNNRIFLDALVIPAQSSSNLPIQLVDMDGFIRRNPAPFLHNPYEQNGDARCMARSTEKNVNGVQWTSTIRPVGAFGDYVQILDGNGCTSPYPLLDEHILRVNQRWRKNSTIRLWRLLRNPSNGRRRIVYEISGCRYCYNIEREHRSNHIFWMVDLEQLVAYQRCHDIDCRGFRSNDFPLPGFVKSTIPSVDDIAKPDFVPQLSTEKLKDELAGVVQLTRLTTGLDNEANSSKLEQEQTEPEPNLTRLRRLSAVYENRRVSEELSRTIDPFADCDDEDD